ncbi:MAG: hypothetical protein ACJAZO_000520 [Myxococcota bacterium]|jgi:hypothetical protein
MDTLDPGTPFGAYTIEGLIAGGGMGSVYAARHTVYGTTCALKVLHPKLHGDESWRKRFEAEGFAGTTLKHPHVLAAREVVLEEDNQIGLVLDLVKEGLTLHRVMSREYRTGVPLVQSLRVFLGIVQGIEYAHSKEIVHGDIKPENVLIQGEFRDPTTWRPMVTDFGTIGILAHPVEIDGMPAVVVSPRYASPEHLKGMVHLEPRSDIYCLGLLLHYIVSGRHASTAKTVETAAAQVSKATSTTGLLNQPEAVATLFKTATRRNIDKRFQSARELALAVRDLLDQLGEGLDLADLQADLATEIVEEQQQAAREQRVRAGREARRAAEQLADESGAPALLPEADHQVSEVATPLGDLPVDDFEDSEVLSVAGTADAEAFDDEAQLSGVVSVEGDDLATEEPVSFVADVEPVESTTFNEEADAPDDMEDSELAASGVQVLPDTDAPADVRRHSPEDPTEDVRGETPFSYDVEEMDVMDMPSAGGSGDVWVGDPATPEGDFEQVDGLTEPVAEERQAESDGTVDELEKPAQESTNNPMFEAVQSSGMSKSLTAVIVVGGVLVIVAIVGAVLATS